MTTDPEDGSSPLEPVPMQAVPPPERRTRAGRNLPAAIGVGLALGAVVLLSLYVWKAAFVAVEAAAIVLAAWELTNAFGSGRIRVPIVPLAVGGGGHHRLRVRRWQRGHGRRAGADRVRHDAVAVAGEPQGLRPGRHRRHLRCPLPAVPGRLRGAAAAAGRRPEPGRRVHRAHGAQRRGRVRRRRAVRQAPDGTARSARRSPGRGSPGRRCSARSAARCCCRPCWTARSGRASSAGWP